MQRLGVFFETRKVGTVAADEGRFTFAYDPSWLDDQASFAISRSLPLVAGPEAGPAAHSFFANLLPEGRIRALVARRLGISEDNDFGLLAALGGECAGAMVVAAATPKPVKPPRCHGHIPYVALTRPRPACRASGRPWQERCRALPS